MGIVEIGMLLALSGTAPSTACGYNQSQELRVRHEDGGYRLDLQLRGEWRTLLTAGGEIALARLALDRAEVAFLVEADEQWTLQLLRLTGESMEVGALNGRPAEMCYDEDEANLELVSASGQVTRLPLPSY